MIKWGILGCGNIANKFAQGLATLPEAELYATGSRSLKKSAAFANTYGAPKAYGSYDELIADPEVEIIYVATPHNYHYNQVMACFDGGKPVLCEKPLTLNAREAKSLIRVATEKNLFFMEAMWTRFLPSTIQLRKWLKKGLIGEVRMLVADFGFYADWEPENRKFNPDLAGGALLDLGIYPITYAYMIFGEAPATMHSFAHLGKTGVDNQSAYLFGYRNGAFAQMSSSFEADSLREAIIMGSKGVIRLPLFWKAQEATVTLTGQAPKHYTFPYEATGLQFEAQEAMACLKAGKVQSDIMPLSETLRIQTMMDRMRAEWGMKYPGE